MNIILLAGGVAGCFVAAGCQPMRTDEGSAAGFTSLVQTCAPWDGPAVTLFLADHPPGTGYPTPPYSSISIYKSVSGIEGRSFEVSPTTQSIGIGQVCPAEGRCAPSGRASLRFGHMAADSTIEVRYYLEESPGGAIRSGSARTRLLLSPGFCA